MSVVHLTPSDMLGPNAASPTTIKRSSSFKMLASLAPRTFTTSKSNNSSSSKKASPAIDYAPGACVQDSRSNSDVSDRSHSTSSNDSGVSEVSNADIQSPSTVSKRMSWTKALFAGARSKSTSSLSTLAQASELMPGHEYGAAGVPGCLLVYYQALRRMLECTERNVSGLILRSKHTETDIMQMVARHCSHIGCRRKLINAAMRNLEKRVAMLNKYRDAIFHFVVNRHQNFVIELPQKKAEADALFDMCSRNCACALYHANRGAHESGTILLAVANRLEKMQRQLNEAGPTDADNISGSQNSSARSVSSLSVHSHGEGDTEDYSMSVVPKVPHLVKYELVRPARMRDSICSANLQAKLGSSKSLLCDSPLLAPNSPQGDAKSAAATS